jgi:hypothetical protein
VPRHATLLGGMAATLNPQLEMVFPLREPVSKRSRSGATGYGECPRMFSTDLATLHAAIQRKEATGFESILANASSSSRKEPTPKIRSSL